MGFIKAFHFLFIALWVGSLLTLTRMMIKHHTYEPAVRSALAGLYSRFYYFGQLPAMLLAVTLGMLLITQLDSSKSLGWFHMKLTFAMTMIGCDIVCSRFVNKLAAGESAGKGAPLLHGISGLMVIGIALSLYVVR